MNILGKVHLIKLKNKNQGNRKLLLAIDKLIQDLEGKKIDSAESLQRIRSDADKVHNSGIYFFNLHIHRALIVVEFNKLLAKVLWVGTHDHYVFTFKNNKSSIEKWLRTNGHLK